MSAPGIIDMRPFMGADLAGVFVYDFPDSFIYPVNGIKYSGLFRDRKIEEMDETGGPRLIDLLEIHVPTAILATVINGTLFTAKGEEKIVVSSELAEDGNELIIMSRAAP